MRWMVSIFDDSWVAAVILTLLALEACTLPLILLSKGILFEKPSVVHPWLEVQVTVKTESDKVGVLAVTIVQIQIGDWSNTLQEIHHPAASPCLLFSFQQRAVGLAGEAGAEATIFNPMNEAAIFSLPMKSTVLPVD